MCIRDRDYIRADQGLSHSQVYRESRSLCLGTVPQSDRSRRYVSVLRDCPTVKSIEKARLSVQGLSRSQTERGGTSQCAGTVPQSNRSRRHVSMSEDCSKVKSIEKARLSVHGLSQSQIDREGTSQCSGTVPQSNRSRRCVSVFRDCPTVKSIEKIRLSVQGLSHSQIDREGTSQCSGTVPQSNRPSTSGADALESWAEVSLLVTPTCTRLTGPWCVWRVIHYSYTVTPSRCVLLSRRRYNKCLDTLRGEGLEVRGGEWGGGVVSNLILYVQTTV